MPCLQSRHHPMAALLFGIFLIASANCNILYSRNPTMGVTSELCDITKFEIPPDDNFLAHLFHQRCQHVKIILPADPFAVGDPVGDLSMDPFLIGFLRPVFL